MGILGKATDILLPMSYSHFAVLDLEVGLVDIWDAFSGAINSKFENCDGTTGCQSHFSHVLYNS
jgi:hypothetical protein